MSQTALNFAIENAFQFLAKKDWDLFDTWYERLHNVRIEGDIEHTEEIESEWNATNLDLMLADAMSAAWLRLLTNTLFWSCSPSLLTFWLNIFLSSLTSTAVIVRQLSIWFCHHFMGSHWSKLIAVICIVNHASGLICWGSTNMIRSVTGSMHVACSKLHWPLGGGVIKYTPRISQLTLLFFLIMTLSTVLSLLAQGNNGNEILDILDTLVADLEQEGINSCAEVFEVWM